MVFSCPKICRQSVGILAKWWGRWRRFAPCAAQLQCVCDMCDTCDTCDMCDTCDTCDNTSAVFSAGLGFCGHPQKAGFPAISVTVTEFGGAGAVVGFSRNFRFSRGRGGLLRASRKRWGRSSTGCGWSKVAPSFKFESSSPAVQLRKFRNRWASEPALRNFRRGVGTIDTLRLMPSAVLTPCQDALASSTKFL